jgi:hypothetical protein
MSMAKQRVMVYQIKDFETLKEAVLELDEKYGAYCNTVGLYRRIGKYCIRVDATAEENILDEIDALLSRYGTVADLNMSQLIRESESMVGDTGIEYIKGGGIL